MFSDFSFCLDLFFDDFLLPLLLLLLDGDLLTPRLEDFDERKGPPLNSDFETWRSFDVDEDEGFEAGGDMFAELRSMEPGEYPGLVTDTVDCLRESADSDEGTFTSDAASFISFSGWVVLSDNGDSSC